MTQSLNGLTSDAKEIIQEEILRRDLHIDTSNMFEVQDEQYESPEPLYEPDTCPVEEYTRVWIENWIQFLVGAFGDDSVRDRQILTPEKIHFPIRYDGSQQSAFETLKVVANQMDVPIEKITLDFYDDSLREITEGSPGGL